MKGEDTETEPEPTGKPFAGFEDFDACVARFEDDPDIDDAEKFCGYLEQEYKASAEKTLTNLKLDYVSTVAEPAQRSEWVVVKSEGGERHRVGYASESDDAAPFLRAQKDASLEVPPSASDDDTQKADEQRKACAAVLVPEEVDKHGEQVPSHEIEEAAHEFLQMDGGSLTFEGSNIDSDHDRDGGKASVVESWTLKDDRTFDTYTGKETEYPEGTWMMMVKFEDEDTWGRVKQGELQGFSIDGQAVPLENEELKRMAKAVAKSDDAEKGHPGAALEVRLRGLEAQVAEIADRLDEINEEHGQITDGDTYKSDNSMTDNDTEQTEKQVSAQGFYELVASHLEGADTADVADALGDVGEFTGIDAREVAAALGEEYDAATGEVLDALSQLDGLEDLEQSKASDGDSGDDEEDEEMSEDTEKEDDYGSPEEMFNELMERISEMEEQVEEMNGAQKGDYEDDEEDEQMSKDEGDDTEKSEDEETEKDAEPTRKAQKEQTVELTDGEDAEDVQKSEGNGETDDTLTVDFRGH